MKLITKVVALDDITQLKTNKIHNELMGDSEYELLFQTNEGNGFSVFKRK